MLEDALVNSVNPINTGIRSIFISIDIGVYGLLKLIYELFFSIATTEILDREMIFNVVSRVQLIIGIFMMFQLVMIIIKGIVNPDSATDSKTGGAGAIVMRIIVSLSLMALLVPINIKNPKNEYEKQIYNNGVLFGTLYSLQYRILTNNTLGKIILDNKETYYTAGSEDVGSLYKVSDRLTSTIVKAFYSLNTKKNNDTGEYEYVCDDDFIEEYNNGDISPFLVIGYGLKKCGNIFTGGRSYALKMSYLISTIVGIVMVIIMFMICFEVAKRVFQLAALQLIAPIPIISYMDPKGSKDGAFNSWVKLLTTTYLDLFTRLAVIYFSFAVITAFMDKFFSIDAAVGAAIELGKGDILTAPIILPLMFIIMVIALLIFAKDAPKFFKQMLGIKDNGNGFFSTFGDALGLGISAAGAVGSFKASRDSSINSIKERAKQKAKDEGWDVARTNQYINDQIAANKRRHTAAGVLGAGVGFATGARASFNAKGGGIAKGVAAMNAMNNRNSRVLAAGRAGGGLLGAIGSRAEQLISGESPYDKMLASWKEQENELKNRELKLKATKDQKGHLEANLNRHKSKAEDCTWTVGTYTIDGTTVTANYLDFCSTAKSANEKGTNVFNAYEYQETDANGTVIGTSIISKEKYDGLSVAQQQNCTDVSYMDYHGTHIPMDLVEKFRIKLKDENDRDRSAKTQECALHVMDYMTHDHMSKDDAIIRAKEDVMTNAFMKENDDYREGRMVDPTAIAALEASSRTRAQAYLASDEHRDDDLFDDSIYNHMLAYRNSRVAERLANHQENDPDNLTTDMILQLNYDQRHGNAVDPGMVHIAQYDIDMPIQLGGLKKKIGDTSATIDTENDEINRLNLQLNETKRRVEATAAEKNRDYFGGGKS